MPLSACRKSVLLEKSAVLHAEETAGTRAEFRFPASGCRTTVLPPSKKRKAQCRINKVLMRHFIILQSSVLLIRLYSSVCCFFVVCIFKRYVGAVQPTLSTV